MLFSWTKTYMFVKSYGFWSFPKNTGKNTGKNLSKSLNGEYSQKLLDHAKQSVTDAFKTSLKRAIQKAVEAAGDLIGNKIADKVIRLSKAAPQNNLERNEEMLRQKHISPELRQRNIDDLRLI